MRSSIVTGCLDARHEDVLVLEATLQAFTTFEVAKEELPSRTDRVSVLYGF